MKKKISKKRRELNKKLEKVIKKIPPSIKFSDTVSYEILETKDFDDKKTAGETRKNHKQIVICNSLDSYEYLSTFLHECIHLVEFEGKFELTEDQVLKLEAGLMKLAEENGLLDLLAEVC